MPLKQQKEKKEDKEEIAKLNGQETRKADALEAAASSELQNKKLDRSLETTSGKKELEDGWIVETKGLFKEKGEEKREEGFLDETIETIKKGLKLSKKKQKPAVFTPNYKDKVTMQIEDIMEQGLEDAYRELTPLQQQEFKIKGEETALKIRDLMKSAHLKIKKVFKLLVEWLKMLPGINHFFLEQEAKIKADRIIELKKQGR